MTDSASSPARPGQRVAPITDPSPEVKEIIGRSLNRDGEPLNIFGTLAHHPKLLKRFNLLGGFLLNKGVVPAREREVVILRVGWRAHAVYEFGQHTIIGKREGLTDAEIAGLAGADHNWSAEDQALIDLADDLCRDDCVSDATYAALSERWDEQALMELVVTAGFYRLVSGYLNTFGVQLDEGVPGWPAGHRSPH